MEKGTRKTRSQINVSSERKMSPFSPDSKQPTHSSQREIDRKGGRGRGKGGKEREKERKREGRQRERKETKKEGRNGEKLLTDLIIKIQTEATLIHPFFFNTQCLVLFFSEPLISSTKATKAFFNPFFRN